MMPNALYFSLVASILITPHAAAAKVNGNVVQFVVYAPQQSDVTHLFPGAQVDFTWNNVYIVTIWTNDPNTLIPDVRSTLDSNAAVVQTIIPPFTIAAATQKWIEYNMVWVALLVLIFLAGCACGGMAIVKCASIKRDALRRGNRCRTTF